MFPRFALDDEANMANGNMTKTIAMYGPSISDPSKVVNRDVPVCDLQAYKAAGYVVGSIEIETHPVTTHNIVDKPKPKRK